MKSNQLPKVIILEPENKSSAYDKKTRFDDQNSRQTIYSMQGNRRMALEMGYVDCTGGLPFFIAAGYGNMAGKRHVSFDEWTQTETKNSTDGRLPINLLINVNKFVQDYASYIDDHNDKDANDRIWEVEEAIWSQPYPSLALGFVYEHEDCLYFKARVAGNSRFVLRRQADGSIQHLTGNKAAVDEIFNYYDIEIAPGDEIFYCDDLLGAEESIFTSDTLKTSIFDHVSKSLSKNVFDVNFASIKVPSFALRQFLQEYNKFNHLLNEHINRHYNTLTRNNGEALKKTIIQSRFDYSRNLNELTIDLKLINAALENPNEDNIAVLQKRFQQLIYLTYAANLAKNLSFLFPPKKSAVFIPANGSFLPAKSSDEKVKKYSIDDENSCSYGYERRNGLGGPLKQGLVTGYAGNVGTLLFLIATQYSSELNVIEVTEFTPFINQAIAELAATTSDLKAVAVVSKFIPDNLGDKDSVAFAFTYEKEGNTYCAGYVSPGNNKSWVGLQYATGTSLRFESYFNELVFPGDELFYGTDMPDLLNIPKKNESLLDNLKSQVGKWGSIKIPSLSLREFLQEYNKFTGLLDKPNSKLVQSVGQALKSDIIRLKSDRYDIEEIIKSLKIINAAMEHPEDEKNITALFDRASETQGILASIGNASLATGMMLLGIALILVAIPFTLAGLAVAITLSIVFSEILAFVKDGFYNTFLFCTAPGLGIGAVGVSLIESSCTLFSGNSGMRKNMQDLAGHLKPKSLPSDGKEPVVDDPESDISIKTGLVM